MPSIRALAVVLVLALQSAAFAAGPQGQQAPDNPVPATPASDAPASVQAPQATAPKAQPDEIQLKLDGWKSEIEQIAAGVQREGQTDRRLADLRERADAIRAEVDAIDRAESPRVAAFEARLKQLGPAPTAKEGEPEPVEADAVKAEREDQQKLLAEAQGRVKQAQLLHLRADEIVKAIAEKRRSRFADDMVERSRSVLEPSVWLEALKSMPAIFSGLVYLLRDWFALLSARGLETATAVGSVIVVFLLVLWTARRRLAQLTERDPEADDPTMLVRAVKATGIALVNIAAPVLSLVGVARALDVFELNPARVDLFIQALVGGVAAAAMVYGIALAILAPGKPQWRMAPVGDQTAVRLLRLFVTLAIVHGFGIWFIQLLDVLAAPVATLILASGLFAVADAVLVMLALRTGARSIAGDAETAEIAEAATEKRSSLWRWLLPLGWILAIGAIAAAFGGYVALASFVTKQMVRVGFLLGALYIVLVLADEAIQAIFQARSAFGQVMTRSMGLARETVEQIGVVLSGLVRLLLIAISALFILAPIGIDGQDMVTDAKTAFFGFRVGGLTFSLSAILTGLAFLLLGLAVTRGIQGWLDQRFLPRTRLDVGLKNSIRTSFGYVGTIVSVALAFSVVGLDLQNLAIVAGALSVGVGFGLQSIVNNFVSGLILLVERPVKAGDRVEIGGEIGYVRRITVRATEIETLDRASLIVPNSSLISGNVKNWMHRDLLGRVMLSVGVSYDADPEKVRDILLACMREHPKVLQHPAPVVFFVDFADSALMFQMICVVANIDDFYSTQSDLRFAILKRLRAEGIEIPFPQRDLNLRVSGDGATLQMVGPTGRTSAAPGPWPTPAAQTE